jgi:hypothetical protein
MGEGERDKHGLKHKIYFKFTIDYNKYDAKNLKMKDFVKIVKLFITEFSSSS